MNPNKKETLKRIIQKLHAGVSPDTVRGEFKDFLKEVTPLEIAEIEQQLISEGLSREELRKLCDVHLAVFREQLEKKKLEVPAEHPLNILTEEHKVLLKLSSELVAVANKVQQANNTQGISNEMAKMKHIAEAFVDAEKHYLREENVLFPFLEKHGITEPPAIMWMEHDKIREKKKQLQNLIEKYPRVEFKSFREQLSELSVSLSTMLSSHFFKENSILFPTALKVISPEEWNEIRRDFDEVGYCCFTPSHLKTRKIRKIAPQEEKPTGKEEAGTLVFETGLLSKEEIEAVLDTLPVDISFVDKNDEVKYFNKAEERIFVRTKAVIGRKVQQCHPQKSVHIVNRILEAFKKGEKDKAEFWINLKGRLVHIWYFAVRDKKGRYLGTLEVTQDITDIKKIEGEKRLLDWAT